MKIGDYKQMMAYLTRPEQPKEQVANLVDELTPGPLKDELTKDYDPSQESYEEYLQRKALGERPFNAQDGGRANLAIGGGAIEGENLGTREGFNRPLIPVSELPKDQKKFINNWLKNNPDKTWEDLTSLQRNDLKKGKNVGVGYGGTTPKGVDNPAFQPLSEKGKKIAQHVYGTTDISDDKRYRINRGEITMDTKPVKFEKGKDISVKMKRGANIADDVIFPNEQMKKDFIKAIKARVQQPEKAVVDFSNKELAKLFPISEKQAGRAAQYFIKDLGLEYAKVKTKTASEIIKNTKNLIKQTSSFLEENRIRSAKTNILEELDLQKKMDTAHRVSKTHMAKLGLEFNTDIMGIDSRLINQIIVKPSEVQLDRLYRKQYDIFEKLKKNPDSIELKNNLKNINKEVTDIVKSTSGRLVGVTIDPDTLETSFQGIKKKYSFSNVLGDSMTMKELENIPKEDQVKFLTKQLPKAIDLEVKRGFVPNDFKNILSNPNSQKAILKYAKQKAPELINPLKKAFLNPDSKASLKLFSSFPAITTAGLVGLGIYKGMGFDQEARADEVLPSEGSVLPGAAAAGTAGAGYALRKPLTKFGKYALQVAGTPLGATGLIAGFGIDPKKAMDRVGIEAELALAPELVKQSAKFSPAVQRILNFGLSPTMAARAARIASPIGIASLGGEALYKYGKFVKDELDRIEKMSPEEREAYNIAEQEQMGVAAADGGLIRQGFRGGGMDMGAGSSKSSKSSGPAGGASSGGNYGGNKNSGPDRSKVSEQQERNNQAAVREAQAFNQKKEETINRIKEAQPKQSPIRTFFDHTNFTKPLKMVGSIPNYHQLGGYDFMSRFPNTPPSIAKSLGYGYQGLFEGIRSLNPFDNYSFQDAMTRAGEEGRLNALGVDAYGNPTNPITQQYYNLPTTLGPNYNLPTTLGPNKEAQTSKGGGLANFIKNNIAPEYRLYTRTMVPGLKTGRLDEEYFPDDFKLDLRQQALDKYTRTGELSGMVNEADQHMSRGEINKLTKFPSTYATLGTYSYQIDPKTLDVKITDKYDWNPAYGTKENFTGFVGNQPEKGGRDVDASMLKDYVVNSLKEGIDFTSGLELLGNLLGPRSSKGEGVDIDINIPTEFAAMRADTSYATGGRIGFKGGGRQDAESQYGADSVGSYDSSQNVSNRDQVYGGNNFKSDPDDNREQYGAQGQYQRPPSTPSDGGDNKINLINTLNKFRPDTFVNPYNFSVDLNKNIGPFGLNSFINTLGILGIDDPRTPEDESEQDDYGISASYIRDLLGGTLGLGAGYSPTTGTNFGLNFSKQFNQGGRVGFADGPNNLKKGKK
jgi:hypothetical protein